MHVGLCVPFAFELRHTLFLMMSYDGRQCALVTMPLLFRKLISTCLLLRELISRSCLASTPSSGVY